MKLLKTIQLKCGQTYLMRTDDVIQNNKDDEGVIMVAGKSFQTLKAIMSGEDVSPYANMIKVLDKLEDIITEIN